MARATYKYTLSTTNQGCFCERNFYQDPYLGFLHEHYTGSRSKIWQALLSLGVQGVANANTNLYPKILHLCRSHVDGWQDEWLSVVENEGFDKPNPPEEPGGVGGKRSDWTGRVRRSPRGN